MSSDSGFRDRDVDESSTVDTAEEKAGISGVMAHSPSPFALARKSDEDECRDPMLARRLRVLGMPTLFLAVLDHALAARKRWLQRMKAVAGNNIV